MRFDIHRRVKSQLKTVYHILLVDSCFVSIVAHVIPSRSMWVSVSSLNHEVTVVSQHVSNQTKPYLSRTLCICNPYFTDMWTFPGGPAVGGLRVSDTKSVSQFQLVTFLRLAQKLLCSAYFLKSSLMVHHVLKQ